MFYHFKVHQEEHWLWAECMELQGCRTQAKSLEKLQANGKDVLNLYLNEPETSNLHFPLPDDSISGKDIINVQVDPKLALAVLLRHYRFVHHLTQKEAAEKLGLKNIYSYQRLEKKSNPSLHTLQKLKDLFPEFSVDYLLN